ncbi:hypothetical protein GH5_03037 [Leishmania sp. Ghana 2012 LV757]|uniref:hypothetical protein n=1 Tax=Leishmania sp. Ghana 2012 LV757 TaxID=2803181 RepID=UPI001B74192C|nr:hypothetical protein GH5_03037 [Leishmania sp. Ghana 2012 LV757]
MQLCSGLASVHFRDGICQDGESVQSMAVNANGTILAVLTQLRIHFWSAGPKVVYLTSLAVPGTSLEDNPAMYVLWRQRQGNHLAVVTARHVAFFEADINLRSPEFLRSTQRKRYATYLHHVDSASRVCLSSEVPIVTGLVTSAAAAGPYAFLATTTAGVVYILGWHRQDILHQWTTIGLQGGGHTFRCVVPHEEGRDTMTVAGSGGAFTAAATAPVNASLSKAAGNFPMPSTPPLSRADPLQRRYQQDLRVSVIDATGGSTTGASTVVSAPARIRPPGTAVRGLAAPLYSNAATTTSPPLPDGEATNNVAPPKEDKETGVPAADEFSLGTTTSVGTRAERPQQPSPLLSSFTVIDPTVGDRRSAGAELLSGTILYASFASRWKVLSFVFSSGSVLLCRTSCGTNFTHQKVELQGCVTPIVSACMVAINVRHLLLAVCTQAGTISCRRIDGTSLYVHPNPLWKGLRGISDAVSRFSSGVQSASQSLGLVAGMEWSPSEELLCVAFYKYGMVLVHYSGGVVTRHLSGPASATLLRTPKMPAMDSNRLFNEATVMDEDAQAAPSSGEQERQTALGCSAISWRPDGTRLWMAAPRQPCFFSTQLSRVLTVDTVGPTSGNHSPLALLADNALYLISVSEATADQGAREMVLLPDDYLRDQYPLLYGAVSSNGSWVACAGRRGLALFNRDRYSWRVASKEEEESFSVVADPVWLRDVAVAVPALRTESKTFELLVFSTSSASPSHASARVALDGRPTQLSCVHQDHRGEGYVIVVDCNQMTRVFRYDVFTDALTKSSLAKLYVALTPVQQLVLPNGLSNPLQVIPVFLQGEDDDREASQGTADQVELRLLLHKRSDHTLVWVRGERVAASDGGGSGCASCSGSLPHVNAVAEPVDPTNRRFVFRCWVDRTAPVRGAVLLVHEEEQGLVIYQPQPSVRSTSGSRALVTHRMEVAATRDSELLPLCPSPFDGYMLCVATDLSAPRPSRRHSSASVVGGVSQASPRPQLALRPILYAHRILSLLLLAAMPTSLTPQRVPDAQDVGACSPKIAPPPLSRAEEGVASAAAKATATSSFRAAEVGDHAATFIWDRNLFYWLERMRLNDTFAAVLDYFLHTALNESPPAAVPGLGRRSAVRAAISLLRNYPEFYAVVVGCVRKIDFTRWHLVLDFLGTPMDLFRECVAHHCYAEAVDLVRVIMMGNYNPAGTLSVDRDAELGGSASTVRGRAGSDITPLQQAGQCAVQLFALSVENGNYTAAYEIMRFMALIEEEIGMPAAEGLDFHGSRGGGAGGSTDSSEGFLTRWLRQLTFSSPVYNHAETAAERAVLAPTEKEKAKDGSSCSGVAEANWVEGFPTLVFDVARCDPAQSGRTAEEAAEDKQRQAAVHHMFRRHHELPDAVHQEALRLLRTGYVIQLAKLMETFSFSVVKFLQAARPFLAAAAAADTNDGAGGETGRGCVAASLNDVFDGLHKELGLPRSFAVNAGPAASTSWGSWLVRQQTAQAAALPGVLSSTNPRVWTVAQSTLYASPNLLRFVQSLHHVVAPILVNDLAFCVLLMRKSNLISLLLSREPPTSAPAEQLENVSTHSGVRNGVSPTKLIDILGQLDALLAVPENAGYRPFLQDVFTSLPPSVLHAIAPPVAPRADADAAVLPNSDATSVDAPS